MAMDFRWAWGSKGAGQAFDTANAKIGADRNQQKTEVIYSDLDEAQLDWKINESRPLASVNIAVHGNVTLGVAVRPRRCVTDQLLAKADVIRAIHERVQLCQDPQTESVLLRASLGVSRINHTLRVHGLTILRGEEAAKTFYEVGQRSLERLCPGFTEDSTEQATLSASQSGIGHTKSVDVARPARFGAFEAAKPQILDMIRNAATARLLPERPLLARLAAKVEAASAAFLDAVASLRTPQLGHTCKKQPK